MANATAGFQNDNRAPIGATHESLWDTIVQIRKDEHHVASTAPKVEVGDTVHMWPTKEPRTIGARSSVQGADPSYDNTNTSRNNNHTQIFQVGYELTFSRKDADAAGTDPWAQERNEGMKDWKSFLEFALVRGTLVTANNSTPGQMKGLKAFASTLLTSQSGVSLSESQLNAYLGNAWDQGMEIDTILVGRTLKQRISEFTGGNTKNIDVEDFKTVKRVDVYEGDFGTVQIKKHRYVTGFGDVHNDLLGYDSRYIRVGSFTDPKFVPLARTGAADREMVYGEMTLQVDNEKAVMLAQRHL